MHPILDNSGNPQTTKIELRTRLNSPIDNLQPWFYSAFEWNTLYDPNNKYEKAGARHVGEICPFYNCHGLTLGNRRTQVDGATATILTILKEDGFERIPDQEVDTGDLVVYYVQGVLEHTGIVLSVGEFGVPQVWSKWGKGFEWVHSVRNCPYPNAEIHYYRLRLWKPEEVLKIHSS